MTGLHPNVRRALWLAAALALVRFWLAGRLDLAEDEAYYWEWSRNLALGYVDQGPGLALAIRLGTWLLGPCEQGVRLLSVLSGFAVSSMAAWVMASVFALPELALWVVLALNGGLIFAVGGMLMMHDSLMGLGWMGATVCCLQVLRRGPRWWPGVGLCAGEALLSKYTAVLLIACLGLALFAVPGLRRGVRSPWPWLGFGIAALGGLPMLVWNAQHDWPSLHHVGSLAGGNVARHSGLPWLEFVGSQLGVLTPLLCVVILAGWLRAMKRWSQGRDTDEERLILLSTLPVAAFFAALSLRTRVEANWPACAYLGAVLLAALWIKEGDLARRRLGTWAVATAWAMTLLVYGQALWPFLPIPQRFAKADAPARVLGWRALGARVFRERALMGAGTFTAARTYQNAAELAFYTPGQPASVLVVEEPPMNNYRFWDLRSAHLEGNAVVVTGQDWEISYVSSHFKRVEALPDEVLLRHGIEVRRSHLWRAYGFTG